MFRAAAQAQESCGLRLIKQRRAGNNRKSLLFLGRFKLGGAVQVFPQVMEEMELLFLFNFPNLAAGI